jgi:hypothetical protein
LNSFSLKKNCPRKLGKYYKVSIFNLKVVIVLSIYYLGRCAIRRAFLFSPPQHRNTLQECACILEASEQARKELASETAHLSISYLHIIICTNARQHLYGLGFNRNEPEPVVEVVVGCGDAQSRSVTISPSKALVLHCCLINADRECMI